MTTSRLQLGPISPTPPSAATVPHLVLSTYWNNLLGNFQIPTPPIPRPQNHHTAGSPPGSYLLPVSSTLNPFHCKLEKNTKSFSKMSLQSPAASRKHLSYLYLRSFAVCCGRGGATPTAGCNPAGYRHSYLPSPNRPFTVRKSCEGGKGEIIWANYLWPLWKIQRL